RVVAVTSGVHLHEHGTPGHPIEATTHPRQLALACGGRDRASNQEGARVSAPAVDVLRWGRERARAGRWRGDDEVAFIAPLPDAPLPSAEFVHRCLGALAARGFTRVVTGALSPLEQTGFLAAGFDVQERLHLLAIDVNRDLPPVPPGLPLRRA